MTIDHDILDSTDDVLMELFGDKEVRWYQQAARNQVEYILSNNRKSRIMIKSPTGTGKTITSGTILLSNKVKQAVIGKQDRPLRVIFIAHKHRLLTQAERAFNVESGIIAIDDTNIKQSSMWIPNNTKSSLTAQTEIYYQSAFSKIPDDLEFDLVIIDEGHHEAMSTIQYHLEKLGEYPIIGLSATPDNRADGFLIKFDHIVETISREQAVEEGWLSPTSIHTFVDVSGKDKTEILRNIFTDYAHEMGQTMVFVKTKKEVVNVATKLKELGYTAVALLSQSNKEVDNILNMFSDGKIQFIVNCMKISEGVDVKNCDTVFLGRSVGSYALLNQIIGRSSRPDSESRIWELVNPLSATNLDTTVVVGEPLYHRLVFKQADKWIQKEFEYITHRTNKQLGIASLGNRIRH